MNAIAEWIIGIFIAFAIGIASGALITRNFKDTQRTIELNQQQVKFDQALKQATILKAAAEEHSRQIEKDAADRLAAADTEYQRQIGIENAKRDKAIADLRANNGRLRITIARSSTPSCSEMPGVTANTSGDNAETSALLSRATTERLIARYSEADQIVQQLTACQSVVQSIYDSFNMSRKP